MTKKLSKMARRNIRKLNFPEFTLDEPEVENVRELRFRPEEPKHIYKASQNLPAVDPILQNVVAKLPDTQKNKRKSPTCSICKESGHNKRGCKKKLES